MPVIKSLSLPVNWILTEGISPVQLFSFSFRIIPYQLPRSVMVQLLVESAVNFAFSPSLAIRSMSMK